MKAMPSFTARTLVKFDPHTGKVLKAWSPDPPEVKPSELDGWLDGEIRVTFRDSPREPDDTQCETWFDIS
jgi:hypothetical protein